MPQPCFLVADISRQRESCSEGTIGPSREPHSCQDSHQSPGNPAPLLLGPRFLCLESGGVVRTAPAPRGVRTPCPAKRAERKVMVLCLLRLQTERPGEARGFRTTALGSPIAMWSGRGQASAGWDPGQGSCGPGRGSPGWPRFLPPGAGGPSRAPPCPLQPLGMWPGGSR